METCWGPLKRYYHVIRANIYQLFWFFPTAVWYLILELYTLIRPRMKNFCCYVPGHKQHGRNWTSAIKNVKSHLHATIIYKDNNFKLYTCAATLNMMVTSLLWRYCDSANISRDFYSLPRLTIGQTSEVKLGEGNLIPWFSFWFYSNFFRVVRTGSKKCFGDKIFSRWSLQ